MSLHIKICSVTDRGCDCETEWCPNWERRIVTGQECSNKKRFELAKQRLEIK